MAVDESAAEIDVPVESELREEKGDVYAAAEDLDPIVAEGKSVPTKDPQPNAAVRVEDLVETGADQETSVVVDQPALSSPPQVIREIRDLKPVRRS